MKIHKKLALLIAMFVLLFQLSPVASLGGLQITGAPVTFADGTDAVTFKPPTSDADSCEVAEGTEINQDNCKIIEYLLTFINEYYFGCQKPH